MKENYIKMAITTWWEREKEIEREIRLNKREKEEREREEREYNKRLDDYTL